MSTLDKIQAAGKAGQLLPSSVEIISTWLAAGLPTWAVESIDELVAKGAWSELNDRFYRYLEFGTGGMRGRTIGVISTAAEQGKLGPQGTPEHAGIGSNVLNDYTLVRATIGLFRYVRGYLDGIGCNDQPKLVIAHDVYRSFPVDNVYRYDLLRQNAVSLGLSRTLLAAESESVLIGAADI